MIFKCMACGKEGREPQSELIKLRCRYCGSISVETNEKIFWINASDDTTQIWDKKPEGEGVLDNDWVECISADEYRRVLKENLELKQKVTIK